MTPTKDQQAQEYAENRLKTIHYRDLCNYEVYCTAIKYAFMDGYTAHEQSQWRSVEEELPEEMERVLVWTGDEALVCWFTSMRRFRTTLSCQERYVEDKSLGIKQHLSPCRADVTEVVTHWQRITLPSLPDTNTEKK